MTRAYDRIEPLPLRLPPGADLRAALEAAVKAHGAAAAFVLSGIGSLEGAQLRLAGRDDTTTIAGAVEIVGLAGSLSADGAHLHMTVADAEGAVVGGHVTYGNVVRTTAEILLGLLPGWRFGREHDAATGFAELAIRRAEEPGDAATSASATSPPTWPAARR